MAMIYNDKNIRIIFTDRNSVDGDKIYELLEEKWTMQLLICAANQGREYSYASINHKLFYLYFFSYCNYINHYHETPTIFFSSNLLTKSSNK